MDGDRGRVTGLAGMRWPVGLGVLGLHWGGFLCLIFCDLYHFFWRCKGEQALGGDGRYVRYANVAVQVDKGGSGGLGLGHGRQSVLL